MAAQPTPGARPGTVQSARVPFPTVFWVTNLVEFLERMAYYGALAVASLRMEDQGLSTGAIGTVMGLLLPLPFLVPILSSALAERFGYKRLLLASFVLYASGFLLFANASSLPAFFTAVVLLGCGSGTFKPVPAATIGIVSPPGRTRQGYSYYYAAINVGGLMGPLLAGGLVYLAGKEVGRALTFYASAAAVALAALVVVSLFRNPKPANPDLGVGAGFARFLPGLRDGRFMALLAIFSGFWFLYSMNFSFLSLYIDDFVDLPRWFSVEMQNTINPLVIVLVGVPLGLWADRLRGFAAMTLGIGLFASGFALIGFTHDFGYLVAGLVIATFGEILAYPGFLAHVAKVAGPDRASAYQSLGFLPIGLGFFVGPLVGGPLYHLVVEQKHRPELFWALMVAIALLTLAAMILYDHALRPRAERPARRARVAAGTLLALLLAPALVGTAAMLAPAIPPEPETVGLALGSSLDGNLDAGQSQDVVFAIPAGEDGQVRVTLTWTDEAGTAGAAQNAPDRFRVEAAGASKEAANEAGGDGRAEITVPVAGGSTLEVTVTMVSAGNQQVGPLPIGTDAGNSWTLRATRVTG